jgi:hypothetical protein
MLFKRSQFKLTSRRFAYAAPIKKSAVSSRPRATTRVKLFEATVGLIVVQSRPLVTAAAIVAFLIEPGRHHVSDGFQGAAAAAATTGDHNGHEKKAIIQPRGSIPRWKKSASRECKLLQCCKLLTCFPAIFPSDNIGCLERTDCVHLHKGRTVDHGLSRQNCWLFVCPLLFLSAVGT